MLMRKGRSSFLPRKCVLACFMVTVFALPGPHAAAGRAGQESKRNSGSATFSVQSQLVQLYITVTEGRRRITDLKSSDFGLTEDGKPVLTERLDNQTVPLQVALLFDISESMRDSLVTIQEAAVSFVDSLASGDRVAVVFFNTDIRCTPQITDDREPIRKALRNSQAVGGTKLYDSVLYALKYLQGRDGRRVIVCFTDGEDTAAASSYKVVMDAAARYGYPIYAIGAGSAATRPGLRDILHRLAAVNSGRSFLVRDPRLLSGVFREVVSEMRSAYVLNYYTEVPFDGAWHDLKVTLANPAYSVHTRRGFFARSTRTYAQLTEGREAPKKRSPDPIRLESPAAMEAARAAQLEIFKVEPSTRPMTTPPPGTEPPGDNDRSKIPVFKVESRFVEVPVLLESASDKELPALGEKDFRVYEDGSLREIAYFARDTQNQGIAQLRNSAMKSIQDAQGGISLASQAGEELLLGRYYLVLDDMLSETGAFLRAREATEKVIRTFNSPLRPFTLHFTSQTETNLGPLEDTATMLERLRKAGQRASRELTTNDGIMTIHQAYLVERGDRIATKLLELRFAADRNMTYRNELGAVEGEERADPVTIQSSLQTMSRMLIAENFAKVARIIDALRVAVNALSSQRATYPKAILFLSSGFVLGRGSGRADAAQMFSDVISTAKRNGIRFFTVDADGLGVVESLGIGARADFLVQNPSLEGILYSHASEWKHEKMSSLTQPAEETGGRFVHNTNDLAAAAGSLVRSSGQLYYLGYLSRQPSDAKLHRIRVTTSLGGRARVHARPGYFANRQNARADSAGDDGEQIELVLARADEARRSGDMQVLASSLEKVSRRFPNAPDVWFNLGIAELNLNHPAQAVSALQQAFVLAPEDRQINLMLSRALLAAGEGDAAAETLERLVERSPRDSQLLLQLGRVYEASSSGLEAFQTYRRILDIKLVPPLDVYLLLARTAITLERWTEFDLYVKDYIGRGGDPGRVESLRAVQQAGRR